MIQKKPIFKQSIIALIFCIIISLIYVQRGDKGRDYFQSISGVLVGLQNTHERFPGKDSAKYRYLEIDNYPQSFQVFIGKKAGDFKPKFENIDNLKVGDSLTVYFEETNKTNNSSVNNLAYFIDRKFEVIFIKGNAIKKLIYGMIIFSVVLILFL
jgi:hypothetical protein